MEIDKQSIPSSSSSSSSSSTSSIEEFIFYKLLDSLILNGCFESHYRVKMNKMTLEELNNVGEIGKNGLGLSKPKNALYFSLSLSLSVLPTLFTLSPWDLSVVF